MNKKLKTKIGEELVMLAIAGYHIPSHIDTSVDIDEILVWTCEYNYYSLAKILIEAGADVNTISKYGNRPLHWVAVFNYAKIAELLVSNGADINVRDEYNKTPLQYAISDHCTDVVKVLRNADTH